MIPNWDLQIVKIKNFKSYNETTYIGPFHCLTGIFGKNGSGKTNLIDGIIFSLGKEVCKVNSTLFKNLPSGFGKKKEHTESRVGVIFSNNDQWLELNRTIDNFNVSEYFIRGVKVSFDFYQKFIKVLGCNFSELMVLKNLTRNKFFLDPFFLSDFIDNISGSKKLTLLHLKISILKKKLQGNCSYFFYKLSFINGQKSKIVTEQKNLINMKRKRSKLKTWKFVECKKKIFRYSQKLWKFCRKIEKGFRKFKEIEKKSFLANRSFSRDVQNFKSKVKANKQIREHIKVFFKYQKLGKIINVSTSEIGGKISEKILTEVFSFIKKKKKKKHDLDFADYEWNWGSWLSKEIGNSKSMNFFGKKFFIFEIYQKKDKNRDLSFLFPKTITRFSKKVTNKLKLLKIKSFIFLGQSRRFFFKIFYFSICLIFILIGKKNETRNASPVYFHNQERGAFINLRSQICGIRGKLHEFIKPLDSKFRLTFFPIFEKKKNIVLIDNQNSIKKSLEFLKKKRGGFYSFLPINNLQDRYTFDRKNKNQTQFTRLFDFDVYDHPGIEIIFEESLFFSNSEKNQGKLLLNKHSKKSPQHDILVSKKEYEVISYNPFSSPNGLNLCENFLGFESQKKNFKKFFKGNIFQEKTRENFFLESLENTPVHTTKLKFFKRESFYFSIFYCKNFKRVLNFYQMNFLVFKKQLKSFSQVFLFSRNFYYFEKKKNCQIWTEKTNASIFLRSNWNLGCFLEFFLVLDFNEISFSKKSWGFFILKKLDFNSPAKKNVLLFIKSSIITRKKNFIRNKLFSYVSFLVQTFLAKNFPETEENFYWNKIPRKLFSFLLFKYNQKKKGSFLHTETVKMLKLYLRKQFSYSGSIFFFPKPKKFLEIFWPKKNVSFFFQTLWEGLGYEKKITPKEEFFVKYLDGYFSDCFETLKIKKKLNFIEGRLENIKNELKKNRHRFYIANSKFHKVSTERKKRFLLCIEKLSTKINSLYRELTSSRINPLGGTAFFSISNNKCPFFGKVLYFAVPPFKKFNEIKNLSDGEKTIASFVLTFCLSLKVSPPFIFFDEIDSNLDNWNSVKLFNFLANLSRGETCKIGVISFKMRFYFFFGTIFYIYLNQKGSYLVTLSSGT